MSSLFHGIISGQRKRSHDEVAERAERIASGLKSLGVTQGDSVCMLMRNDIAFIEAAYAAMRLGAYGVPINWHFKPEERSAAKSTATASSRQAMSATSTRTVTSSSATASATW